MQYLHIIFGGTERILCVWCLALRNMIQLTSSGSVEALYLRYLVKCIQPLECTADITMAGTRTPNEELGKRGEHPHEELDVIREGINRNPVKNLMRQCLYTYISYCHTLGGTSFSISYNYTIEPSDVRVWYMKNGQLEMPTSTLISSINTVTSNVNIIKCDLRRIWAYCLYDQGYTHSNPYVKILTYSYFEYIPWTILIGGFLHVTACQIPNMWYHRGYVSLVGMLA